MKSYKGKKVIVRSDRAGVFYGTLEEKKKQTVQMLNVRKLFYWSGAAAVEQIALEGVKNPSDCKFTVSVEEMIIEGVIQIIPCTEEASKNIETVSEWKR